MTDNAIFGVFLLCLAALVAVVTVRGWPKCADVQTVELGGSLVLAGCPE